MSDTIQVRGQSVKTFFCAVAIVAVVAGVTASQAQMIDNFTANDLANYDQTVVLAQGTDTPTPDTVFSWDSVNDALQVSRTTGTTPEQNVFAWRLQSLRWRDIDRQRLVHGA